MEKIDRVKDLPLWFDLEKYRQAETFGEKEWFEQLAYRKWLLMNNPEYPVRQTIARAIVKEITYKDESGEMVPDGALLFSGEVAIDHAEAMAEWRKGLGRLPPLCALPHLLLNNWIMNTSRRRIL